MGATISGVFQKRDGDRWIDISSDYDEDQDWYLFAWLAPYPFSGRDFPPIAECRGFPADFQVNESGRHPIDNINILPPGRRMDAVSSNSAGLYRYMKERCASWLLASEILNAPAPRKQYTLFVFIETFREWDGTKIPIDWIERFEYRMPNETAFATPDDITNDTEWVIVEFDCDFTEHFRYFVDEVRRLSNIHGEVRFVFSFC